jgi:predicted RNA-binding Zn-ribbon protein involved in translation (DUF1610 family)
LKYCINHHNTQADYKCPNCGKYVCVECMDSRPFGKNLLYTCRYCGSTLIAYVPSFNESEPDDDFQEVELHTDKLVETVKPPEIQPIPIKAHNIAFAGVPEVEEETSSKYFCANKQHPDRPAQSQCRSCKQYWCEGCLKSRPFGKDNIFICPACSGVVQDIKLVEAVNESYTYRKPEPTQRFIKTEHEYETPYYSEVSRILLFPFRGLAPYWFFGLTVVTTAIMWMVRHSVGAMFVAFAVGMAWLLFMMNYLNEIIQHTFNGKDEINYYPEVANIGEGVRGGGRLSVASAILYGPAQLLIMLGGIGNSGMLSFIFKSDFLMTPDFKALSVLALIVGILWYLYALIVSPAVIMGASITGSAWKAVHPAWAASVIFGAKKGSYLILWVVYLLLVSISGLNSLIWTIFIKIPFLSDFMLWFGVMYSIFATGYLLGRYARENKYGLEI